MESSFSDWLMKRPLLPISIEGEPRMRSFPGTILLLLTTTLCLGAQTQPSSDDVDDLPPAVLQHFPQLQRNPTHPVSQPITTANRQAPPPTRGGASIQDPAEGAFTAMLPAGWRVSAGTQRSSRMEPHYVIRAQSPQGGAELFFDDPSIPLRQLPGPATDAMGWREGMMIPAPAGIHLLLERYRPGAQAAGDYVTRTLCPAATNFQGGEIAAETDQLMQEFGPIARAEDKQIRVDAGELSFQCGNRNGYVYTITLEAEQPGAPVSMWLIYRIAGYLASPQETAAAADALHTLLGSFEMSPQWLAQFARECNDIEGNSIRESNAVTQATIERARQQDAERESQYEAWKRNSSAITNAIERTDHAITGSLSGGSGGEGHNYNAQLGTKDVCDDLGRCHTVDASVGTYYTDCAGTPYPGTTSGGPPPSGLSACWNKTH